MGSIIAPSAGAEDNSVAAALQALVTRMNEAIASGRPWGRTEQEIMRRDLAAAAEQARAERRSAMTASIVLDDMICAVEKGVLDLTRCAEVARRQAGLTTGRAN